MTEKMENALRHISSSLDVDPWAIEEVEKVFKAYEQQPQDGDLISRQAVINAFCNESDISSCPYRDKGKKYASCDTGF